ncbi:response regulator, partial [bacterium]|nr:response regulator [bacterium]
VKIIVVDDNEDLANAIQDYYNNHDQGIEPISTSNPSDIPAILEKNPDVKLILTDYYMPEINGIELLKSVHQRYPHILFILMTGYHSVKIQEEGLMEGVVTCFRKPFSINKLTQVIHETMNKANSGFGGVLESVQLPDIVQLINTSQRSVALKLNTADKEGSIFFENGEIIHAETEELSGEEAFYDIFNWVGGSFHTVPLIVDVKKTIKSSTTTLIIEAARRQDETIAWSGNIPDEMLNNGQEFGSGSDGLEDESDFDDSKSRIKMMFDAEKKEIASREKIAIQNLNHDDLNSKVNIDSEEYNNAEFMNDEIKFDGSESTEPEITESEPKQGTGETSSGDIDYSEIESKEPLSQEKEISDGAVFSGEEPSKVGDVTEDLTDFEDISETKNESHYKLAVPSDEISKGEETTSDNDMTVFDTEGDTAISQSETTQSETTETEDNEFFDPDPEIELTPFEPRYAKTIYPDNTIEGSLDETGSTDLSTADNMKSFEAESADKEALEGDFNDKSKSMIVHSSLADDQGYVDSEKTTDDVEKTVEKEEVDGDLTLDELPTSSDFEMKKDYNDESYINENEGFSENEKDRRIDMLTSVEFPDDAIPEATDEIITKGMIESEDDEEKEAPIEKSYASTNFKPDIDESKFEIENTQAAYKYKVILNDKMIGETIEKAVNHFIEFWPEGKNEIKASSLPLDTLPEYIQAHFQFRFQQDLVRVVHTENLPFNFENEEVSISVQNLLSALFRNWEFTRSSYLDILRYAISFELARSIDPAQAITEVLHEMSDGIASKIKSLIRSMINFGMIGDQYLALIVDISRQGDREINSHTLEYLCRSVLYRLDEEQRWLMFKDAINRMLEIARVENEQPIDYVHFNVVLNMLEAHGLAQVSDYINMTREMGKMELSVEEAESFFGKYKTRNQNVAFD